MKFFRNNKLFFSINCLLVLVLLLAFSTGRAMGKNSSKADLTLYEVSTQFAFAESNATWWPGGPSTNSPNPLDPSTQGKSYSTIGDVLLINSDLYVEDSNGNQTIPQTDTRGRKVGTSQAQCVVIGEHTDFNGNKDENPAVCQVGFNIQDTGQIIVHAVVPQAFELGSNKVDFAITGGTNQFSKIRGDATAELKTVIQPGQPVSQTLTIVNFYFQG